MSVWLTTTTTTTIVITAETVVATQGHPGTIRIAIIITTITTRIHGILLGKLLIISAQDLYLLFRCKKSKNIEWKFSNVCCPNNLSSIYLTIFLLYLFYPFDCEISDEYMRKVPLV